MPKRRHDISLLAGKKFVCYTGMETDLIFTQKIELPEFAAFPLLQTDEGRHKIDGYYRRLIELGRQNNVGVMLDSVTWAANLERAAKLGNTAEELIVINRSAIEVMSAARDEYGDLPTLLNANIGPRFDAYSDENYMSIDEACAYHAAQINVIAETEADLITAYTMAYANEALGMVLAAKLADVPIVISFTVETDGCLPSGMSLVEAMNIVDDASESYCAYFMINCAHPEHFEGVLEGVMASGRLRGLVVNASKCSHAELDNAVVLDDGNPDQLGASLRRLQSKYSQLKVIGGCCGTDLRHLAEMFGEA